MKTPTNYDLQREIRKYKFINNLLLGFILGMFLILIIKATFFVVGMVIGVIVFTTVRVILSQEKEQYKPEW